MVHFTLPGRLGETSVPISLRGRKTHQLLCRVRMGPRPQEPGLKCTPPFLAPTPLYSGTEAWQLRQRPWRWAFSAFHLLWGDCEAAGLSPALSAEEAFASPPGTRGGHLNLVCPTRLGLCACCFFSPSDQSQTLDLKGNPPHRGSIPSWSQAAPSAWCLENRPPQPLPLGREPGMCFSFFLLCSPLSPCGPGQRKAEEGFPVLASEPLPQASCQEGTPVRGHQGCSTTRGIAGSRDIYTG